MRDHDRELYRGDARGLTRRELIAGSAGLALVGAAGGARRAGASADGPEPAEASGAASPATSAAEAMRAIQADPDAAVDSGEAWIRFCDALKPLARHVTGPEAAHDPLARVEGIRCLSRLVSLGLDRFLEHGDPRFPAFYDLQTPTRKYLGDNPDQTYRGVAIEGGGRYRVHGSIAGAAGVEIGVYAGSFRSDDPNPQGGRRLVDSLDETTLEASEDGRFEITLGGDAAGAGPNHLRLAPDANAMLIRTYFWDRRLRLEHAWPRIERLDVEGPAPPLTPEALLRGLFATPAFVDGSLAWWNRFQGIKTEPNELIVMPDDGSVQTPSLVRYLNGVIELEREQALVLEFTPRDEPAYWSWVLQNVWGETPDWRDRPVVRNNHDLEREADGRIRIVIAHEHPPGVANWMDMAGHRRLLLSLRWRGESPLPEVTPRVLPLAAVPGVTRASA